MAETANITSDMIESVEVHMSPPQIQTTFFNWSYPAHPNQTDAGVVFLADNFNHGWINTTWEMQQIIPIVKVIIIQPSYWWLVVNVMLTFAICWWMMNKPKRAKR